MLLLYCKNTKLKAIHNKGCKFIVCLPVVAILQKYKIESNSQPYMRLKFLISVVAILQKYKIESNSQLFLYVKMFFRRCCYTAKIQNWKQFTTNKLSDINAHGLLLYCKNTKLKAIHNQHLVLYLYTSVVAILQKYKIESNSQHSK